MYQKWREKVLTERWSQDFVVTGGGGEIEGGSVGPRGGEIEGGSVGARSEEEDGKGSKS